MSVSKALAHVGVQVQSLAVCLLAALAAATSAAAQAPPRGVEVAVDGLMVWQQRNDVRIPVYAFAWLNAAVGGVAVRF